MRKNIKGERLICLSHYIIVEREREIKKFNDHNLHRKLISVKVTLDVATRL